MVQLTYYADRRPAQARAAGDAARLVDVRHGFTLHDLDQMTHAAMIADRSLAMDYAERRDIAWSAIAEHLCAAETPPHRQELIRAGWQAIYQAVRDSRREHGYHNREFDSGHASAPRFAQYWYSPGEATHEERIIETIAVGQVLDSLSPIYRDALDALARMGDYAKASELEGITYTAFVGRIGTARRRARALWHQGETPRRVRQTDRRIGSYAAGVSTHCGRGHERTPETVRIAERIVNGKIKRRRVCIPCEHERYLKRKREAATSGGDSD